MVWNIHHLRKVGKKGTKIIIGIIMALEVFTLGLIRFKCRDNCNKNAPYENLLNRIMPSLIALATMIFQSDLMDSTYMILIPGKMIKQ